MAKEKTDWVKFTLRLDPETAFLMHKYCKEPTTIIRELVRAWVKDLVRKNLEAEEKRKQAGDNIQW